MCDYGSIGEESWSTNFDWIVLLNNRIGLLCKAYCFFTELILLTHYRSAVNKQLQYIFVLHI